MTADELTILLTGAALGFVAAAGIMIIGYIVLTIKEKRNEIKHRQEHRLENLMMAEAERGLEDRDG